MTVRARATSRETPPAGGRKDNCDRVWPGSAAVGGRGAGRGAAFDRSSPSSRGAGKAASRGGGGRRGWICGIGFGQLEGIEVVGLAPQLIGHHRRLRRDCADHGDAQALALQRFDQRAEIAVAGKQRHVIDVPGDLHGVDREVDVDDPFDRAAAGLIDELLGRLRHHRIAVVVEPIDQRPERRIFLILDQRRIIESTKQIAARLQIAEQTLVIDVEAERLAAP